MLEIALLLIGLALLWAVYLTFFAGRFLDDGTMPWEKKRSRGKQRPPDNPWENAP